MPKLIALILALLGGLAYLLYPVGYRVQGEGVLQPAVESLVPVWPDISGFVSRVDARPPAPVTAGMPLLAVVPSRDAGVLGEVTLTKPGGVAQAAPAPPPEIEQASAQRFALATAGQRWLGRVGATRGRAGWELDLAQRLALAASRTGDLLVVEARTRHNERRGRFEANLPQVFDHVAGRLLPSDRGAPLLSPAGGTLVSLWAAPMTQVFEGAPIGEVMPEGAPTEVITVVPELIAPVLEGRAAVVRVDGAGSPPVSSVMVGRTTIEPADARMLVPGLEPTASGKLVRLRLAEAVDPRELGRAVRYELSIAARPRVWGWITGR